MTDTITAKINITFDIEKKDFLEYLEDNYCAYDKKYRPELSIVLNDYIGVSLYWAGLGEFLFPEDIDNIKKVLKTLENWTNEYFKEIDFNEEE